MTVPFVSADDLGTFMGQDLSASDLAVTCLDAACETVRTYLGRTLNLRTETVTFDGTGTDALAMPDPIVNIVTITADDEAVDEADVVMGSSMLYRTDTVWPIGRRNISVLGTFGYAVDESDVGADSGDVGTITRMPSDIREVALELAQAMFNAGGGTAGAVTGETIGDYSYTVDAASAQAGGSLSVGQRSRLAPYRFRPIG